MDKLNRENEIHLHKELKILADKYGYENVVATLKDSNTEEFFNINVLSSLAREARKNSLQLVGLVGDHQDKSSWDSARIFNLSDDDKKYLSTHVRVFDYSEVMPDYFDPLVADGVALQEEDAETTKLTKKGNRIEFGVVAVLLAIVSICAFVAPEKTKHFAFVTIPCGWHDIGMPSLSIGETYCGLIEAFDVTDSQQ